MYLGTALRPKGLIFNQKPINRLAPLIGASVFVGAYHNCKAFEKKTNKSSDIRILTGECHGRLL